MDPESQNPNVLIETNGLSKVYGDGQVHALAGVSLQIREGEFLAITGPSGCGKSTLLNLIGALDQPTSGEVQFRGDSLASLSNLDHFRAREIGFVFQTFYLLPNLTSEENVQIPMFETETSPRRRTEKARELLRRVGLGDRMEHLPSQLSIGQRQRVAIARALANDPAVILADEPTGALDSASGLEILALLDELNRQGTTLIVVTHDDTVARGAKRIIRLRDGKIEDSAD